MTIHSADFRNLFFWEASFEFKFKCTAGSNNTRSNGRSGIQIFLVILVMGDVLFDTVVTINKCKRETTIYKFRDTITRFVNWIFFLHR